MQKTRIVSKEGRNFASPLFSNNSPSTIGQHLFDPFSILPIHDMALLRAGFQRHSGTHISMPTTHILIQQISWSGSCTSCSTFNPRYNSTLEPWIETCCHLTSSACCGRQKAHP